MDIFSKRNQFDPEVPKSPVVEDAPRVLRLEYWTKVLKPLTYIDGDSRYQKPDSAILGEKALLEDLCILFHVEPDANMSDSWVCTAELENMVKSSEWYRFYDIIEAVGTKILRKVGLTSFSTYRDSVNQTLANNIIAWRLNAEGVLSRTGLEELEGKNKEIEDILQAGFPMTLQHLRKARRFVTSRPLDPENAIKESVSAVGSCGRVLYPNATTLGDVVKELRKRGNFPNLILSMMEKFYAFASAEPGVRHGAKASSTVSLIDADFCLYVSIAFTDYLHKLHGK